MPLAWLSRALNQDIRAPLLADRPETALLLRRLEQARLAEQALLVAAHALPAREAVWWACRCAGHARSEERPVWDEAAAAAAEAWVRMPDGPHRARAYAAAHHARFASPEALAALAAFWSGAARTLALREDAAATRLAESIGRSVHLSSLCGPPAERAERLHRFLASAHDIDRGGTGHLVTPGGKAPC
ncbi:DUF6931 family protein [Acidisoma sp. C75]